MEGDDKGFKKKSGDCLVTTREARREAQIHEELHSSQGAQCIAFLSDLDILIDLLSHTDHAVCLGAAMCFEALVSLYGFGTWECSFN